MPSEEVKADAKDTMLTKVFRRSSLTPSWEEGKIKSSAMLCILNQMGQEVDEGELNKMVGQLEDKKAGTLDFNAFKKICERFLTHPAALEMSCGDQFAFQHLVTIRDFAHEGL